MGGRHDGNSVASGLSRTPCVGALSRTSTTWNCGLPKAKERRSSFDPGHLYRSHRGADFDGPYRRRRLQGLRLIVTERNNQALPAHYCGPIEKLPHVMGCAPEILRTGIYRDPRNAIVM